MSLEADRTYGACSLDHPERPTESYNHRADRAHEAGWTGKGLPQSRGVIAVLGAGIKHNYKSLNRTHKAFYEDGNLANAHRVRYVKTVMAFSARTG